MMKNIFYGMTLIIITSCMVVIYIFGFQMTDSFLFPFMIGSRVFLVLTIIMNIIALAIALSNWHDRSTGVKE